MQTGKVPNYKLRRWIALAIAIIAVFGIAGIVAEFTGRDTETPDGSAPSARAQAGTIDPAIVGATAMGANFNVDTDLGERADDAVFRTGETVIRLGKALQAGMAGPTEATEYVVVIVRGPTLDRLGNVESHKFMQMRFAITDLRAANYVNLSPASVLDLADQVSVRGVGRAEVDTFCATYGDEARRFCADAHR